MLGTHSTRIFRKSVSSWRKIFSFLFPSRHSSLPELPIFFITFLISYPPASVTVIQIPIVIYVDINGNPQGCPVVTRSHPCLDSYRTLQRPYTYTMRPWVQILYFIESEREKLSLLLSSLLFGAPLFSFFFLLSTDFLPSLSFAFLHGWES